MSDVAKCPNCEKYIDVTFGTPESCPKCDADLKNLELSTAVHERGNMKGPIIGFIAGFFVFYVTFALSSLASPDLGLMATIGSGVLAWATYSIVVSFFDRDIE